MSAVLADGSTARRPTRWPARLATGVVATCAAVLTLTLLGGAADARASTSLCGGPGRTVLASKGFPVVFDDLGPDQRGTGFASVCFDRWVDAGGHPKVGIGVTTQLTATNPKSGCRTFVHNYFNRPPDKWGLDPNSSATFDCVYAGNNTWRGTYYFTHNMASGVRITTVLDPRFWFVPDLRYALRGLQRAVTVP
jgi:hypothetical protein